MCSFGHSKADIVHQSSEICKDECTIGAVLHTITKFGNDW